MNSETIKAYISTAVVVVVAIAGAFGIAIDENVLTNVAGAVVLIAATVYGCWKNHNFTEAAQAGQALVNEIKAEEKAAKHARYDDETMD